MTDFRGHRLHFDAERASRDHPLAAKLVAKVKPAVIAVTVKLEEGADTTSADAKEPSPEQPFSENSPLHRYFFGSPEPHPRRGTPLKRHWAPASSYPPTDMS